MIMPVSTEDPGARPCRQPNCDNESSQRVAGWCAMHYLRLKNGSPPMDAPSRKYYIAQASHSKCSETECNRRGKSRGFCERHYSARRKAGTLPNIEPKLCPLDNFPAGRAGVCDKHYYVLRSFGQKGISALLEYQKNGCAICGNKDRVPAVDHDHSCCGALYSGKSNRNGLLPNGKPRKRTCGECVRDALCAQCNVGIGYFNENRDRLKNAVQYLEKWEGQ